MKLTKLLEGSAWHEEDSEFPIAWKHDASGQLLIVGVDAGGRDMTAFADIWPPGTSYDDIWEEDEDGDERECPDSVSVTTYEGEGAKYELVTDVESMLRDGKFDEAWSLLRPL